MPHIEQNFKINVKFCLNKPRKLVKLSIFFVELLQVVKKLTKHK